MSLRMVCKVKITLKNITLKVKITFKVQITLNVTITFYVKIIFYIKDNSHRKDYFKISFHISLNNFLNIINYISERFPSYYLVQSCLCFNSEVHHINDIHLLLTVKIWFSNAYKTTAPHKINYSRDRAMKKDPPQEPLTDTTAFSAYSTSLLVVYSSHSALL